jgi:penicillin amidase
MAEYDWRGFADASTLPQGRGGEEDFFAHANNLMIDPAYSGTFFHVDSAPSYRFDRITELLRLEERQTPQSFARIQGDILLLRAQTLLPRVLEDLESTAEDDPIEKKAYALLKGWNGEACADAPAPAIFFLTYREAIIEALRDEVDSRGLKFILSQRYSTNAFDSWMSSADHIVWDDRGTPDVETRAGVVQQAFQVAVAQLRDTQGNDPSAWRWGRLHDLHIQHVTGSQRLLAGFVNLPWTEAPGASASVWKSHFDLGHSKTPFRAMAGPVSRMIVDMADIHHGLWILDTGVSGWPGSPHYGDQHELWKRGEYLPMVSNWDEIEAGATAVMTLIGGHPSG